MRLKMKVPSNDPSRWSYTTRAGYEIYMEISMPENGEDSFMVCTGSCRLRPREAEDLAQILMAAATQARKR